ncbi:MAG TPA: TRAP transporter small permease subunit [Candidatus Thiothrix moscowensis]|uniref:TRAP transporter small permease subunit n=1 Tax=unclassified Thiothrix TaxID=2636184 RepID=UPI001A2759B4|nr:MULTISPECIES: TRAP transporter small permease subunit [unclassified Thiothrix]MBJ6610491.1 TRAP transporter small permease subunit [Candidatus Thiothrix moscowensis]HRJ52754.1 TRAP transporter small permease subunit [Candidatus Thiothrix moscowensis]HRJ92762.1 TRAP transporter small permease subunit [Candidatus Thiothrix moscowensis]
MGMQTGYEPVYRIPVVDKLNGFVRGIAHVLAWVNVVVIATIVAQVVLRYGFSHGLVALEELIWQLYAVGIMFGLAYAVTNDTHIRVDIVRINLSPTKKHVIEILGVLFLLMPFIIIIFHHSLAWVWQAYEIGEASSSPTGLGQRWIVKSIIPLSFALLFVAALARLLHSILLLMHKGEENEPELSGRVSLLRHLFSVQKHETEVK